MVKGCKIVLKRTRAEGWKPTPENFTFPQNKKKDNGDVLHLFLFMYKHFMLICLFICLYLFTC